MALRDGLTSALSTRSIDRCAARSRSGDAVAMSRRGLPAGSRYGCFLPWENGRWALAVLFAMTLWTMVARPPTALAAEPIVAGRVLADYVHAEDPTYAWEIREELSMHGCQALRLHLQSQTWKGTPWKHVLYLIRPDTAPVDGRDAVLVIAGGSWNADWPPNGPEKVSVRREALLMATVAKQFNCPIAVLSHVPFQPLLGGKYEDEIIAETFARYVETEDPSWPLLLPMVKAAVRGMDATIEAVHQQWGMRIESFTVTGASKRGWTTWLTGAIDPRARAIAPMVIDMLNMEAQMRHQLASWGAYSEQIADYTELDLPNYLGTPRGRALQAIVDPFAYRHHLQQPKLLIFGTNDRYWPVDACNLYWDQLEGDKYLLYVPNQGHGLDDYARIIGTTSALHRSLHGGEPLPKLAWKFTEDADQKSARLHLEVQAKVDTVRGWVASSSTRDFRDAQWHQVVAQRGDGDGQWRMEVHRHPEHYVAWFGEVVAISNGLPSFWSTTIQVLEPGQR
ncbi:MAG: PhoPQ-activated pathogenicity protein [Pirellulaceae bacterium]|nr:MAG: PhoPQ-activated pathogenicity protein [Pirellulaceae bacterium]